MTDPTNENEAAIADMEAQAANDMDIDIDDDSDGVDGESAVDAEEDLFDNVSILHVSRRDAAGADPDGQLRMIEALLFAAAEPLDTKALAERLPEGADIEALLDRLKSVYEPRGINLIQVAGKWAFRTAADLAFLLERERIELKKLSRAAIEALAVIAYHQPVTRTEVEEIRGVALSKGTIDVLLDAGWIRPKGRRETPGRPMTYGTTEDFLIHFGLDKLADLPGIDELKAAGLLDAQPPAQTPLLPGLSVDGDTPADGDDALDIDQALEAEFAERAAAEMAEDEDQEQR